MLAFLDYKHTCSTHTFIGSQSCIAQSMLTPHCGFQSSQIQHTPKLQLRSLSYQLTPTCLYPDQPYIVRCWFRSSKGVPNPPDSKLLQLIHLLFYLLYTLLHAHAARTHSTLPHSTTSSQRMHPSPFDPRESTKRSPHLSSPTFFPIYQEVSPPLLPYLLPNLHFLADPPVLCWPEQGRLLQMRRLYPKRLAKNFPRPKTQRTIPYSASSAALRMVGLMALKGGGGITPWKGCGGLP
jgi:hypothetical protein